MGVPGIAIQLDRDHPSVIAHLLPSQLEGGMIGQSGIEYLRDTTHLPKGIGQLPGIGAMAVHSDGESLQTAQNEIAIHRPWDGTGGILSGSEILQAPAFPEPLRRHQPRRMPAQILGGAVHHEVRTQPQRLLQIRRRKRVVHDNPHFASLGQLSQSRNVDHI